MEHWQDIPGFEGCYQASTAGRVRSLDRNVQFNGYENTAGTYTRAYVRRYKGKILRPAPDTSGHMHLRLDKKTRLVHRLVLLTFIGAPSSLDLMGMHLNHDPSDNSLRNLKWGTQSENTQADFEVGNRRRYAVVGVRVNGGAEIRFASQADATVALSRNGKRTGAIQHCLKGRANAAYGYVWRYA